MSDDLLNNQGTDYAESTFSSGSHVKSIHAAKDASSRPQPLNLTGWPEMAETLRQVDEDKVKDYKEDIDTLLVFAGLFSGVLTAFLIQSSQSLSEDTSVTAVTFLRQISAQTSSYSFNAGFFNSTVHPLAENLPPFVAAPSAVRINALWFASLTLALVTASFAMLVKQWLREYLSAESTSAKARIRIREFRSIGLQDWKVFEIAAILPLLLQISLGLFFIGLCLFSWSAHAGIGYTTTPIVIGWAFLFFNATLAPMISARCPYKTTLLKRAMQTLRRMLCSSRFLRTFYCGPMKGEGLYPLEERDAAADDGIDIAILTTADAILLDDDLLATTIRGSLQETRAKPAEIMSFVLEAVRQRLQETSSFTKLTHFLDLSQLTERAWRALINITAQTLILDDNDESPVNLSEDCREDAITIILSSPGNFLTPEADNALASCMRTALVPTCRLIGLRHAPQSLSHILQRLRNTFRGLNTEDTLRALFNIVLPNGDVCDAAHGSQSHTFLELGDLLLRHTGELPYTDIGNILQDCVNRGFLAMDFVRWTPSTINIALVIAVDAVRADDKLLTAVLQNVSLDDGAQLSLILKLCMHTLCIPSASLPCIPQLHYNFNLSVSRWTIIVKTVAQILLQRMRQYDEECQWDDWEKDAITIFVGFCDFPLPQIAELALEFCMARSPAATSQVVATRNHSTDDYLGLPHIFQRMRTSLSQLGAEDLVQSTFTLIHENPNFCHPGCTHTSNDLAELLVSHAGRLPHGLITDILLERFNLSQTQHIDELTTPEYDIQLDSDIDLFFELFVSKLLESLPELLSHPRYIIKLAIRALQRRIPTTSTTQIIPIFSQSDQPPPEWTAIINIVAQTLAHCRQPSRTPWEKDAISILLCCSNCPPTPDVTHALQDCMLVAPEDTSSMITSCQLEGFTSSQWFAHVFRRLDHVFDLLRPADVVRSIFIIVERHACNITCADKHLLLVDLLHSHSAFLPMRDIAQILLRYTVKYISQIHSKQTSWSSHMAEILDVVGELFLDDNVLEETVFPLLGRALTRPSFVMEFIFDILRRRLGGHVLDLLTDDKTKSVDLSHLHERLRIKIVEIIFCAMTISSESAHEVLPSPRWLIIGRNILSSFFSNPPGSVASDAESEMHSQYMTKMQTALSIVIAPYTEGHTAFVDVLTRLRTILPAVFDAEETMSFILALMILHYDCKDHTHLSLEGLLFSQYHRVPFAIIEVIFSILMDYMKLALYLRPSEPSSWRSPGIQKVQRAIFAVAFAHTTLRQELVTLIPKLMSVSMDSVLVSIQSAVKFQPDGCMAAAVGEGSAQRILVDGYVFGVAERRSILQNLIEVTHHIKEGSHDKLKYWNDISAVKLCLLIIRLLHASHLSSGQSVPPDGQFPQVDLWVTLFAQLGSTLLQFSVQFPALDNENKLLHISLAGDCLGWLEELDEYLCQIRVHEYRQWVERFQSDKQKSIFPDDLFVQLATFVPKDIALDYKRVRLIGELAQGERIESVPTHDETGDVFSTYPEEGENGESLQNSGAGSFELPKVTSGVEEMSAIQATERTPTLIAPGELDGKVDNSNSSRGDNSALTSDSQGISLNAPEAEELFLTATTREGSYHDDGSHDGNIYNPAVPELVHTAGETRLDTEGPTQGTTTQVADIIAPIPVAEVADTVSEGIQANEGPAVTYQGMRVVGEEPSSREEQESPAENVSVSGPSVGGAVTPQRLHDLSGNVSIESETKDSYGVSDTQLH